MIATIKFVGFYYGCVTPCMEMYNQSIRIILINKRRKSNVSEMYTSRITGDWVLKKMKYITMHTYIHIYILYIKQLFCEVIK